MGIHFIRPYWFLALIPLALVMWKIFRATEKEKWHQICDAHLLPYLLEGKQGAFFYHPLYLLGIAWFITIFALSGPSFNQQKQMVYRSSSARIIVLSLAESMYDNVGDTTKIDRAKFKIFDFLNKQREGQTGLMVYSGEPHLVTPLTDDNKTIANLVPVLDPTVMPVAGNNTALALEEAAKLFAQTGVASGDILLITDQVPDKAAALDVVKTLHRKGIRLFILDMSAFDSLQSDLKKLALEGNGDAVNLSLNDDDIDALIARMDHSWLDSATNISATTSLWQDQGRWFAALIIPLALFGFRRGYL